MTDWGFEDKVVEDTFVSPFAVKQHTPRGQVSGDEALKAILREVQGNIARNDLFKNASDRQAVIHKVGAEQIESYNTNAASLNRPPLLASTEEVYRYLLDHIIGWGPLAPLMEKDSPFSADVEDIIVLAPDLVVVYRAGSHGWERADVTFENWEAIRQLVNNKTDHRGTGKAISEANPRVDAQLEDGSRLHAIMSPLTVVPGPIVTIRRFRPIAKSLEDMIRLGHMSRAAAAYLEAAMIAKFSLCVIGSTGSGKTTLANSLLSKCQSHERIITCEDTPEIQIPAPFWTQLTTKQPTRAGGDDGVDMAQLVKENLRMRPDRIIIGEARGPEMGAILQAGNTGHSGILFTIHSNDPKSAISRMETLALMDPTLSTVPIYNLRQMITMALDGIVHVGQMRIGEQRTRRLLSITELRGMNGQVVGQEEIFRYDPKRGLAFFNAYPHQETQDRLVDACPGFDFQRDVVEAERAA